MTGLCEPNGMLNSTAWLHAVRWLSEFAKLQTPRRRRALAEVHQLMDVLLRRGATKLRRRSRWQRIFQSTGRALKATIAPVFGSIACPVISPRSLMSWAFVRTRVV